MNIKSYIKNFGIDIFLSKAIRKPFYGNKTYLGKKICLYNEKKIKDFLYVNVIQDLKKVESQPIHFFNNHVKKNSVIWTMWWQGLNNAPCIVKACINNLKKYNPTRDVIVISKENYKNYLHLNSKIINDLNKGNISITHFSDIYRVNLLYVYGGAWIDSTIFETKTISDSIFDKDFYTIKTGKYTNDPSHGRWTTFFMESQAGNKLMNFLRLSFDIYCNKYSLFIDYILFDYFIAIAVDMSKEIQQVINTVPVNNSKVFELEKYLDQSEKLFDYFMNSDTYLYKLTYKKQYDEGNFKKGPIIFGNIIRES